MRGSWRLWSCSCPSFVQRAPAEREAAGGNKRSGSNVPLLLHHLCLCCCCCCLCCCCWPQIEPEAWSSVSQQAEWRRSSRSSAGPPLSHSSTPEPQHPSNHPSIHPRTSITSHQTYCSPALMIWCTCIGSFLFPIHCCLLVSLPKNTLQLVLCWCWLCYYVVLLFKAADVWDIHGKITLSGNGWKE